MVRFLAFESSEEIPEMDSFAFEIMSSESNFIIKISPSGSSLCETKTKYFPFGEIAGEVSFDAWLIILTVVMSVNDLKYIS